MKGRAASPGSEPAADVAARCVLCRAAAPPMGALGLAATLAPAPAAAAQSAGEGRMAASAAAVCTIPVQTRAQATQRIEAFASHESFGALPFEFDLCDTPLGDTHPDITPGSNRRCKVAFAGTYSDAATRALKENTALPAVLGAPMALPRTHRRSLGTAFTERRELLWKKRAVVHLDTRPRPVGLQTFINVERRTPPTN